MHADPLVIAGRAFGSRLIVGTGKYPSNAVMAEAHNASGADMVTVAVRRVNLTDRSKESLLDYIDTSRIFILPNTAGCYTADDAVRTAQLGRELGSLELGEARGDRRRADALPRQRRAARGHAHARQGRLRRPPLHERRPDHLPQARRGGRRRGDAARRADRVRPRHPEREQHPDHPRAVESAGDRRRRRRYRVGRCRGDGARRRRRPDEHGDRAGTGSRRDGRGDEARRSRRAGWRSGRDASQNAPTHRPAARSTASSVRDRRAAPEPDDQPRGDAQAARQGARRGGPALQRGAHGARPVGDRIARHPRSVPRVRRSSARRTQRRLEHRDAPARRDRHPRQARQPRLAHRGAVPAAPGHLQLLARRSHEPQRGGGT